MSFCRDVVIFRQAPDFVMSLRCDAVATVLLCRDVMMLLCRYLVMSCIRYVFT